MVFCSSLSKSLFSLLGCSYVDDCDLLQSQTDPSSALQSMQEVINSWSDLMAVIGGKIETTKSWWYLADIEWKRGKWHTVDAQTDDTLATTQQEQTVQLTRLPVADASKMLGIWMSLDSNHNKMLKHLRSETLKWASKIQAGNPSHEVAWMALHQTIAAQMKYSMPISRYSKKECDFIMAPAIAIGLSKSGINRNFPRHARHAPITSGGLHVLSLYNDIGVSRMVALLKHCYRNNPTGKLMQLNIEHLVLETGMYGPLWKMKVDDLAKWCDTRSWIFHTVQFNHDTNIDINISHTQLLPQRTNDKSIMELALQFTTNPKELKAINRVRMLHEVIHLSNITMANGLRIDPAFLVSEPFPEKRNQYTRPKKHHVTTQDYTSWRKFVNYIYCFEDFRLQRALTHWTQPVPPTERQSWHWFLDTTNNVLYEGVNNTFVKRLPLSRRSRNYQYNCTAVQHLPASAILAFLDLQPHHIHLLNTAINCPDPPPPDPIPPPTFTREDITALLKQKLPPWASQQVGTTPTLDNLKLAITNGTAVLVSNGSHFPHLLKAGAAWCISTLDYSEFICGGGAIPGNPNEHDSYRSEVVGLIGSSAALQAILPLFPLHAPTYSIVCDNESALLNLSPSHHPDKTKWRHCDLVSILKHLWEEIPCKARPVHVYGHQDKLSGDRSPLEIINIHMDKRAKACAKMFTPIQHHGSHWNSKGFGLVTIDKQMVGGAFKKTLYEHIGHTSFITYISDKWGHDQDTTRKAIAWPLFAKARKVTRHHLRIFISKWLIGHLPTW